MKLSAFLTTDLPGPEWTWESHIRQWSKGGSFLPVLALRHPPCLLEVMCCRKDVGALLLASLCPLCGNLWSLTSSPLASSVSAVAAGQYFSANNPSPDKLESNIASDCIPSQSRGWTLITLISSSVLQASKALAVSQSDHVYVHGTYTHFFFLFQLSCVW